MTIRDIAIAFGFEIDKASEDKVNKAVEVLKSAATDALNALNVGFETDKASEEEAIDSVNSIAEEAKTLEESEVGYKVDEKSEREAINSINEIKNIAIKALGAIGIGFSLVKMKDLAEEFNGINDQIRDATRGMGEQQEIQQQIMKTANETRMSYGDMADSISKLAENKDVFGTVEEAAGFAELLAKEFKASGKGSEEVRSLMQSMTMSISKGEVDSRAMMALFRESPRTLNMMAESLGVTTETLQDMVSKGQVSAETLKNVFEKNADSINSRFGELDYSISDALLNIRNQWGYWLDEINSTLGITRTIAAFMVKSFDRIMAVLRRAQDAFLKLANKMGGVEKVMKLLAIAGGAILAALNADKIMAFLKAAGSMIGKINLKTLALVAVFVLIALIIEDLVNFMQGNDSLIGSMLGEEEAALLREQIQGIVDAAKALLPKLAELGKTLAGVLLKALKSLIPLIVKLVPVILKIAEVAVVLVDKVLTALINILDALMPLVEDIIDIAIELIGEVLDVVIELLDELIPIIEGVINAAMQIIEALLPVIIQLIEALLPLVMQIIETVLPIIIELVNTLLPLVFQIIDAILPVVLELITAILPILTPIIELISNLVGILLPPLLGILESVLGLLKPILDLLGPIADVVGTVVGGLANIASGAVGLLGDVVGGIGEIFGFAEGTNKTPDTFIAGEEGPELITGAKNRKVFTNAETGNIFDTLKGIVSMGAAPSPSTVGAATSSVENKSVVQNNQFTNQFYGDRAGQEKSAEAAERSADSATELLAHGLNYAR